MSEPPQPQVVAAKMMEVVDGWNATTPRGQQSAAHRLGISDIGMCREYARWMTVEQAFTDEPNKWEAFVGSAIDRLLTEAVSVAMPNALTNVTTVVTLPSGATYPGHPDLVFINGVLDNKTVDGLTQVRRQGPTLQQQFQRHLYYAGLLQEKRIEPDGWVGNVWWDRSGRESMPHVQIESYDPTWLHRADDWISDVLYAVQTGERTMKDKPTEWCSKCCEFFTVCRTEDVLTDSERGGLIEDPDALDLIDAYKDARDTKKECERVMDDVRRALADISGRTTEDIVKWIFVNSSEVPGYTRSPYSKLDIRPIPRARK
jgi:hypothetical protein